MNPFTPTIIISVFLFLALCMLSLISSDIRSMARRIGRFAKSFGSVVEGIDDTIERFGSAAQCYIEKKTEIMEVFAKLKLKDAEIARQAQAPKPTRQTICDRNHILTELAKEGKIFIIDVYEGMSSEPNEIPKSSRLVNVDKVITPGGETYYEHSYAILQEEVDTQHEEEDYYK